MKANHLQASTGNPSEDIDMTDVDLPENSNEVNLVTYYLEDHGLRVAL